MRGQRVIPSITRETLTGILTDLVHIDSVNPALVPGAAGERAIAEAIAARLSNANDIQVELQDAGGGRPNVIAVVGGGPGRTLLLNGHIDTVGVAGMDDPFGARINGNRLYGRGAGDMKCGVAAMLALVEAASAQPDFPGTLVATFVADEEYASIGTEAICRDIARWKPDAALVLESTELDIVHAHKGFVWAELETRGVAAHGSDWRAGVDAIARMGRVLVALERYASDLTARAPHPIVGPPSVHAALIHGGQELSSYPERCVLEIERRTIPGETVEQVRAELQGILDEISAADPTFQSELRMGFTREPVEVPTTHPLIEQLRAVAEPRLDRALVLDGMGGWADMQLLNSAGVPCVMFGPHGAGAHAVVEWADLDVLETFTNVLAEFVWTYCAG
jgi:acetylornithine deacetylase